MTMNDVPKLVAALDTNNSEQFRRLSKNLVGEVDMVKVGLGHLGSGLDAALAAVSDDGHQIFLDLKLFDIHETVARAVEGLCHLPLGLLTVHGDPHVVRAAVEGRKRGAGQFGLLAITLLTSLDHEDLLASGYPDNPVETLVLARAERALDAGADGVVASAMEANLLREKFGPLPMIVTPGIRPMESARDDQKRVVTPADAVRAGASHLVVGRPIMLADDPVSAARSIRLQMQQA